ncbi:polyketide synthase [Orbilia brochopaga]|uniref:Polyketide synthase n=1 Tax=Orbilia brochopaga TaxID=3140254 RepID=A0AAV9U658_9PEZI
MSHNSFKTMPIAITGMACRFPDEAQDLEKFWEICAAARNTWSEWPKNRMNENAFYHPRVESLGTAMDPQIRMLLETTYEAFESAGLSLEDVAGTSTSVFAGAMFHDYEDMLLQDHENLPRSILMGNGQCDAEMAVVGGANLILFPSSSIALSSIGLTGREGKSYGFDERAAGYGRGEGIAAIVLKSLDAALRDNDPIRAVIRETGMNQDGHTPTITSPSQEAQENLIRAVYARAGLNLADTTYVESHGTGTVVGDTIETGALGRTLGANRPPASPLFVGSVKANFGHTEATSGLAAVIKVVLMLEKGYIPPQALFHTPSPKIDFEGLNLKVPTELMPWPDNRLRRASVNNFGAGGTNAHAIIESLGCSLSNLPGQAKLKSIQQSCRSKADNVAPNLAANKNGHRFLLTISAKEEKSIRAAMEKLARYSETTAADRQVELSDLAYTLTERRSKSTWRAAVSVTSIEELCSELGNKNVHPSKMTLTRPPRLGFVFTGQGAQWFAMGRELVEAYPVYREALEKANKHIRSLGASWDIFEELSKDEKSTHVNQPFLSFPLSVILQLALVQLLRSWGIVPTACTGHSSGEISAAYAANILTFEDAIAIAYVRGEITSNYVKSGLARGGMTAMSISKETAVEYLGSIHSGTAVIACVNSPASVTLSGDISALEKLEEQAEEAGVFHRRLKVPAAYHSPHMQILSGEYHKRIEQYCFSGSAEYPTSSVLFASPVTGKCVKDPNEMRKPEHWISNMVQCVEFDNALRSMIIGDQSSNSKGSQFTVDALVEIGPHGALQGPIRQILSHPAIENSKITIDTCLKRKEDAVGTLQSLAGRLFCQGYPVNFSAINFPIGKSSLQVITDLPPYQWNHSTQYWSAPASAIEALQREHAPHDLLGSRVTGLNTDQYVWRNTLRTADIPWMHDHCLQGQIIFPGAGWAAIVIEAMGQIYPSDQQSSGGYTLTEIELYNALVVPENDKGVEIQLVIRDQSTKILDRFGRKEFHIFSLGKDGNWVGHFKGMVAQTIAPPDSDPVVEGLLELQSQLEPVEISEFYTQIQSSGPTFGPTFQNISELHCGPGVAVATLTVADTLPAMPHPYESPVCIHPTTLDACFQLAWATMSKAALEPLSVCLPTNADSCYLKSNIDLGSGSKLKVVASLQEADQQGFVVSLSAFDLGSPVPTLLMKTETLKIKALASTNATDTIDHTNILQTAWGPDITSLSPVELKEIILDDTQTCKVARSRDDFQTAAVNIVHDVLTKLDQSTHCDSKSADPNLIAWMRKCDKSSFSLYACKDDKEKQTLYQKVFQDGPNGELLNSLLSKLGGLDAVDVAAPEPHSQDNLIHQYHAFTPQYAYALNQLKSYIRIFSHKYPRAKILEIGAGEGAASAAIFEGLSHANPDSLAAQAYEYTDIRADIFLDVRQKFDRFSDQVRYQRLDIEQSPSGQGFAEESYDLIVACNVLHLTNNLRQSIQNVRSLLKPGGKLLLLEVTTPRADLCLINSMLPNWWITDEEQRKNLPLLAIDEWESMLTEGGFGELDLLVRDTEDPHQSTYSLMVTSPLDARQSSTASYPNGIVLLELPGSPPAIQLLIDQLVPSIETLTSKPVLISRFGNISLKGSTCIIFAGANSRFLSRMNKKRFEEFKKLIAEAENVMWVSQVSAADNPEAAMHIGMLRTLRIEQPDKKFISLTLDSAGRDREANAIRSICDVFRQCMSSTNESSDYEFSSQSGKLLVPRLTGDITSNRELGRLNGVQFAETKTFTFDGPYTRLEAANPGLLDSLVFKEDDTYWNTLSWTEDMVEITPYAFGLNFRDVLVAMGMLNENWMAYECAGYISKVGAKASHRLQVGDRVCAVMHAGHWANKVRVPWTSVVKIPTCMSFEKAASVPIIYVTSFHALVHLAQLTSEECILIHSGAGGVGQAAITIAQHLGAKVLTTVSSEEKKDFLVNTYKIPRDRIFSSRDASFFEGVMDATAGKGVDVVLNSLAGPLLQASWDSLAPFGRFIELGKRDAQLGKTLSMRNFTNVASYISMDTVQLAIQKGSTLQRSFQEVMKMFEKGLIEHKIPILPYGLGSVSKAFRKMQSGTHIGKIVVNAKEGEQIQAVLQHAPIQFNETGAYLIVGGLSGIGLEIARWMARHGAKNLFLVSRSAEDDSNHSIIKEFVEMGTRASLRSADVADKASLEAIVRECGAEAPIRGVIQAAVVLQDSMFENMTCEQWEKAIRPKVDGSKNLDKIFRHPELDFFIMLSSATAVLGNPGQINYTAAGTYQDALACHRVDNGLPGVSINIGVVSSVGVAARATTDIEGRLNRIGYRTQDVPELLNLLEIAIRNPYKGQMVTGIQSWTNPGDINWRHEPRFAALWQSGEAGGDETQTNTQKSLKSRLAECSKESVHEVVTEALVLWIANIFGMSPSEINPELPLTAYGVDSSVAGELRNWLVKNVCQGISIFDVVQSKSARDLASKIGEKLSK